MTQIPRAQLKLTYSTIMFSSYFLLLKALGFSPGVFNFILTKVRIKLMKLARKATNEAHLRCVKFGFAEMKCSLREQRSDLK